jgi:hypothetical protein
LYNEGPNPCNSSASASRSTTHNFGTALLTCHLRLARVLPRSIPYHATNPLTRISGSLKHGSDSGQLTDNLTLGLAEFGTSISFHALDFTYTSSTCRFLGDLHCSRVSTACFGFLPQPTVWALGTGRALHAPEMLTSPESAGGGRWCRNPSHVIRAAASDFFQPILGFPASHG